MTIEKTESAERLEFVPKKKENCFRHLQSSLETVQLLHKLLLDSTKSLDF